jgi:hypothetical protein
MSKNEDFKNESEDKKQKLLNLTIIDTTDYNEDNEINNEEDLSGEENAITELNDVAILSSSKISLKSPIQKKNSKDSNGCKKFYKQIPLKGFIFTILCALVNSIASIFTKLCVHLSGTFAAFA